MIEDGVELFIGERIGDVLNECKSRKEAHFREEQKLLVQLDRKSREMIDSVLEDMMEWGYEDCRTAYCAGMEDGIRVARKILSV